MRPADRRILGLAVPALAALAADPLVSLADTAFVSRLGTIPLAALGVDAALFGFVFFGFNFLAYATTPMVARHLGRGERVLAGRVVVQALTLAGGLGVVVAAVLVVAAEPLVRLMQAGPAVVDPAVSYLRIRALAAPALLVVTAGHGAFRGYLDTRTPLKVALAINLVNLVLDPILIFGLGWGIEGAAWGTVVAQVTGAAWFGVLLARIGRRDGWEASRPSLSELAPFLRTGGVLTIRSLFLVATLTAATAVAARLGAATVAAHQVVQQTWLLLALTVDSLAIAAQALVADELGRGERSAAGAMARRLGWWGLGAGVVLMVALGTGAPGLAAAFAPEPAVAEGIRRAALVAAVMQPVAAVLFVADGVYLGLLQVRRLAWSSAAGAGAAAVVLGLTLALGWGLTGVWCAIVALVVGRLAVLAGGYPAALSTARS